ncbi:unnamed protein product [Eruca vesicaria subsp. sativa]|uniref:ALOG domain-containing protein n=1 Tax=Eruca vesicaria subsp. sativa TaxID=29727 RepID=A0ABC8KE65_ERUVS|nr:unnamed protein product [Eruca vesicaria subsp. sativa]
MLLGLVNAINGNDRAAYKEKGGRLDLNPFAARAIRIYLREVKESQAEARGIPYQKKKWKLKPTVMLDVDLTSGIIV